MILERTLRGVAGTFLLISLLLAHFHSPWWFLLTTFMGLNLLQSGFSNWQPMKSILRQFGMKSCEAQIEALKSGGA
jgi:hypothetical protein